MVRRISRLKDTHIIVGEEGDLFTGVTGSAPKGYPFGGDGGGSKSILPYSPEPRKRTSGTNRRV